MIRVAQTLRVVNDLLIWQSLQGYCLVDVMRCGAPTGQNAGLSVDDACEDGVVLGLLEVVDALRIAQEPGLVAVRVMHLDGEGDWDIKGQQILGDAAHTCAALSACIGCPVCEWISDPSGPCKIAFSEPQIKQAMPQLETC